MAVKLDLPSGIDLRTRYEIKRARRDHLCEDYPFTYSKVIRRGDHYLVCTEFPGGQSGFADSAKRPVRLRLCLHCAPDWVQEQWQDFLSDVGEPVPVFRPGGHRRDTQQPKVEYGIAYGTDLGGELIEPGVWVELTDEWDDGTHISEAGTYYQRVGGGPWTAVTHGIARRTPIDQIVAHEEGAN